MKKTIPKPVFEFWNGLLCIFPGSVAFRTTQGAVEEAALSHDTVFCSSIRKVVGKGFYCQTVCQHI